MSTSLENRVADLRERAQEFNDVFSKLQKFGPALRSEKNAFVEWQQLMLDGSAIRAAIQTSGRMIDGASKWVAKTFQREALDAIPFAADVVQATTNGSIGAIDNYLERARTAIVKFEPLYQHFLGLGEDEKARLTVGPIVSDKKSIFPALILIGVLGGLVWFTSKPDSDNDDDDDLTIFDYD